MIPVSSVTHAEIDLVQLAENYSILKRLDPDCELMCIMKADAYGHGAAECARVLFDLGARHFGVATVDEALELRSVLGAEAEILILSFVHPQYARLLSEKNIMQTVMSKEYAVALAEAAMAPIRVQIKLNTGMNRIGFNDDAEGLCEIMETVKIPNLIIEGIFTHFACADMPSSDMTLLQANRFEDALRQLEGAGCSFRYKHQCNSAGYINFPALHMGLARCGIILYGLLPSDNTEGHGIKPIMTLRSSVSQIHKVKKGESVSYGAIYTADKDSMLATVQMGYADGFIRGYSSGNVYINGKKCPIRGRVCMDQFICDISDAGSVKMGDDVILFDAEHKVDELARAAGTINYESICMISKRVPRIYKK